MDTDSCHPTLAEMLKRLAPARLRRLIAIRQAFPDAPVHRLPEQLKREVEEILTPANGAAVQEARHSPPRSSPPDTGTHAAILGADLTTGREIALLQRDRLQGLFCIGATGTGKTTLLHHLILSDIRAGLGICLIEPHGDLTRSIIATIPDARLKDVIYLDLTEDSSPFGLNLFQCDAPQSATEVAKVASFVMHVFEKVWGVGTQTPQLAQVLRNVTRTLIENPAMTFAEIPLLLWDETVREKLTGNLKNTQTQLFWQQYNRRSVRDRDELTASTMNKVDAYLNEPMVANIVSQSRTTINFRKIMDEGKILLVNLSPQLEEMSRLVGALLIGKLLMASFSRVNIPEGSRKVFMLYVDEFQKFCTDDFSVLISESRKFRVAIGALANQTLQQLDDANRAAALAAGSLVAFRVSGDDGKVLARSYDCTPEQEQTGVEPIRAPVSEVISHLVRRGHNDPRVAMFAQNYLQKLEHFTQKGNGNGGHMAPVAQWLASYECFAGVLTLTDRQVQKGRGLLNQALYNAMVQREASLQVYTLAVYVLAVAQGDGREYVFSPWIKSQGFLDTPELWGFEDGAEKFGRASFIVPDTVATYINAVPKKIKWMAEAVVAMLTELRYCLSALARDPIMVDTGQYQPTYRMRTYADMEGQIANELAKLDNFTARVKLLTGEHLIRTHRAPNGLSGDALTARIRAIKEQMISLGYVRYAREVEKELADRHEQLKSPGEDRPRRRHTADDPPPTHF